MKKLILPLVAVLFCMAGCQKENGLLYLVAESYTGDAKLHLDNEHYAVWDNGDEVLVNGNEYTVAVGSNNATIADVTNSTSYTAIFPADWASTTGSTITYPATQTYSATSIDAPMAAYSEGTNKLNFKNLGSILAVKVTNSGSEAMSVQKIEVTAEGTTAINGTAAIDFSGDRPTLGTLSNGTSTTILNCNGTTIAAGSNKIFHIAMPPVEAQLTIKVYDQYFTYTKAQTEAVTMEANHGYNAPVATTDSPVQFVPKNNQILYTATIQFGVNPSMEAIYSVSDHTFANGNGILTFSTDITIIPEKAFYNLDGLTSVTLPVSVITIKDSAFADCNSLTTVDLSYTQITTIANNTFAMCRALTSISWPATLTSIGNYAFQFCSSLTSMTLPASLTSIGDSTFYECVALASISLPETLTTIGDNTFQNCSALTALTLPDAVTTLGNKPFNGTTNLTSINLPANLTTIGATPFANGKRNLNTFYCNRTTPYTDFTAADLGIVPKNKTLHVPADADSAAWATWFVGTTGAGTVVDDL